MPNDELDTEQRTDGPSPAAFTGAPAAQAALRAIGETPWAIRPEVLAQIVASLRAERTVDLAADEDETSAVRAAIGDRQSSGGSIAIIPMQGVIRPRVSLLELLFGSGGSATIPTLRSRLRAAVADSQVSAIVFNVDSPGGMVDGVPELAAEIRDARRTKPVVAVANTTAASGAYWLASQADELWVTPSGSVGSIGVFTVHEDFSAFDARLGVKVTLISAGKYKTEGNPYEPLSEEARAAAQARIDTFYGMFVDDVAAGRRTDVAAVRDGFGQGRMELADAAVAAGMADRVGTIEDAIGRASELVTRGTRNARAEETDTPTEVSDPAPSSSEPVPARISVESLSDPRVRRALAELTPA